MQNLEFKILAYLKDELDLVERHEVEQWVALSDANQKAFEQIERIYLSSEFEPTDFNPNVDLAWEQVSNAIQSTKNSIWTGVYKIAAMITLVIGLGFIAYQYQNESNQIVAKTSENEILKIELADGSVLWLNENSEFSYSENMDGDERVVNLNGQAYFDIAKDPNRPFRILGEKATVEVLGTSFDLISTSSFANVNVTSGKVAFGMTDDEDVVVTLLKGNQATLEGNTLVKNDSFNENASSWMTKDFVFKSLPLSEVVTTLAEHFDVKFKVDDAIKNCLITSSFEDKNLEEILITLEAIANIKNEKKGKSIKLTGPGC